MAVTVPSAATEVDEDSVAVVTVPSAATEVEVDSEAVAVVAASTGGAAGVSWAVEISGAVPRAATKAAAAMMRMEDFMCIAFSSLGGLLEFTGELYNVIQNN